jgi:thymidylate synthase (FAD)
MTSALKWKKYPVLNDGFICLVDSMGDDAAIIQAAKVSYGNDLRCVGNSIEEAIEKQKTVKQQDRALIRYLMNHQHWTPFEMVELKFLVRVPMDCWRQWIRHRTANVNEYSTRYKEAIDSQQATPPEKWRLQAADNKQGSNGYLKKWPKGWSIEEGEFGECDLVDEYKNVPQDIHFDYPASINPRHTPGDHLTNAEFHFHRAAKCLYKTRVALGIAKEQARKDLPLSTYTEAYWKCDLRNIFNFLHLRMDSHAQEEIRLYANAMYEIVKQVCPIACEAFEDYVLNARKFSAMEMEVLTDKFSRSGFTLEALFGPKPDSMTDREWKAFLEKLV